MALLSRKASSFKCLDPFSSPDISHVFLDILVLQISDLGLLWWITSPDLVKLVESSSDPSKSVIRVGDGRRHQSDPAVLS